MSQKRIVGVSYDLEDPAPLVMLKAAGPDAEKVLDEAKRRADLPIIRDPNLINQLYRVPIDQPIGRELFPVMAVLLAHVLKLDRTQQEEK